MNKEVHYEGWLIKSPPTKRIWRARWRRRWFTLKQGEIPEQFCLEYYTDRNCRKLKGVIDLDQCEQVDCGLRLENRKQKFQFMFDIKTPKRTYYLAADTEADMRDWVNCICQVCHLHDTKQSNDLQADENRSQTTGSSSASNNTTTTTINSSTGGVAANHSNNGAFRQSFSSAAGDILRRPNNASALQQPVIEQQPLPLSNNSDCAYVNTDYNNRETLLCDTRLDQQLQSTTYKPAGSTSTPQPQPQPPASPGAALYLNSSMFQTQSPAQHDTHNVTRLAINANGVVRKIPENLVLNTTPLADAQQSQHSVQPSPALSTASGPYIPISECFSGSPKFILDGNNPTTPLNNLDPKFYDTPRSHNNIGLNLTNDQSYSPKITNCSLQQLPSATKHPYAHRSDSDSESVFTDDDEWAHPLPLRENVDRSTRPSDSSVENESFVVTYSQRFSKLPDDVVTNATPASGDTKQPALINNATTATEQSAATTTASAAAGQPKGLKNKNILNLDFKEHEKLHRDLPQLSDTENTSPAIGPRDANSVVEESYDIPRSHHLPYYNMCQLYDKMSSPDVNPIAASTPNLIASAQQPELHTLQQQLSTDSVKTLPRPHFYTNAAPSKVESNVFRYDFIEQGDLPPVNRKLKPKVSVEDKPPEESPARPPQQQAAEQPQQVAEQAQHIELVTCKMKSITLPQQSVIAAANDSSVPPLQPPTVDRKLKPYPYKFATTAPASRRSTGAPLSMCIPNDGESTNFVMETRTLPRQQRTNYATSPSHIMHTPNTSTAALNANSTLLSASVSSNNIQHQHQRTVSATAALPATSQSMQLLQLQAAKTNEHKLQYFELDIANAPAINRQSLTATSMGATGSAANSSAQFAGNRFALPADPAIRAPNKSTVVYNSVDFVKTEAFKRVREESKKKRECVNSNAINNNNSNNNNNNATSAHNNNK